MQGCTRAQILTFLWIAMGSPQVETEVTFADVQPGAYYYNAVAWAVKENITVGVGNGQFGVYLPCTRAQVVTFLYHAMA